MVVSPVESSGGGGPRAPAARTPPEVVWHDIECGSYSADLALWRELAERSTGPVLDVGAGAGRVCLELARAGHAVTALDLSSVLLGALRERAAGLPIETVTADARSFELSSHGYGLCIVPMQSIQLLGGADGRSAFLRCARAHLRDGGTLACALLSGVEPFDCADGDAGPAAESASVDGLLYLSRPTRVAELGRTVVIERERRVFGRCEEYGDPEMARPAGVGARELNVIELDRVSPSELEREASEAGFHIEPARAVAATDEHVGSVVVMLCA